MEKSEIIIPHMDVNDTKVVVENVKIKDLDYVSKDQYLFNITTAKASQEIFSNFSGYIVLNIHDGEEIEMGKIAAYIFTERKDAEDAVSNKNTTVKEIKATKKAIKLAEENGLDIGKIKKDGIITEKDVLDYMKSEK